MNVLKDWSVSARDLQATISVTMCGAQLKSLSSIVSATRNVLMQLTLHWKRVRIYSTFDMVSFWLTSLDSGFGTVMLEHYPTEHVRYLRQFSLRGFRLFVNKTLPVNMALSHLYMSEYGLSPVDRGRGDKNLFGERLLRHVALPAQSQYFKTDWKSKYIKTFKSAGRLQLIKYTCSQTVHMWCNASSNYMPDCHT